MLRADRARKRLVPLVGKSEAIALLGWAADVGAGHIAFLQLGGERLVYDAIESTMLPAHFGESIQDVLGAEAARAVVQFALRAASDGLRAGKSHQLIRDEVRVELLNHLRTAQSTLLEGAAEHASLIVEAAQSLQTAILVLTTAAGEDYLRRAAMHAAAWEHSADEIVRGVRTSARRTTQDTGEMASLLISMDDAIDDLEEAHFLLTVLPVEARPAVRTELAQVAGIAVTAARENLKAHLMAREVVDERNADDLEDFLVAVDQVTLLEHEADGADRRARAALLSQAPDFRSLHVADSISCTIEDATDALMRSCLGLRDHVLS